MLNFASSSFFFGGIEFRFLKKIHYFIFVFQVANRADFDFNFHIFFPPPPQSALLLVTTPWPSEPPLPSDPTLPKLPTGSDRLLALNPRVPGDADQDWNFHCFLWQDRQYSCPAEIIVLQYQFLMFQLYSKQLPLITMLFKPTLLFSLDNSAPQSTPQTPGAPPAYTDHSSGAGHLRFVRVPFTDFPYLHYINIGINIGTNIGTNIGSPKHVLSPWAVLGIFMVVFLGYQDVSYFYNFFSWFWSYDIRNCCSCKLGYGSFYPSIEPGFGTTCI